MGNGVMEKGTDLGDMCKKMDLFIRGVGKMISQMEVVEGLAQKARFMKGNGLIERCKEREFCSLKMEPPILVNG
jgi:hypothetical protein